MNVRLRYVTKRQNKDGERWYWQRKGWPLERLSDDPAERFKQVTKLNDRADGLATGPDPSGVNAIIEDYLADDAFTDLKPNSQAIYRRWCGEFRNLWADLPVAAVTRPVCVKFIRDLDASLATKRHARAVLQAVLGHAHNVGFVRENPALDIRLKVPSGRKAQWETAQITAWLEACEQHRYRVPMRCGFLLMLYSAQRPKDVLALTWSDYTDGTIRLTQMKTGKAVAIHAHSRTSTLIVPFRGNLQQRYNRFYRAFLAISKRAGTSALQARDLRRTAVTALAASGSTGPQIAKISGHSVADGENIVERYLATDPAVTRPAIERWEEHDGN